MSAPIVHVITDLDTGGAEMMLYKLLAASGAERERHAVISLIDGGTVGPRIEQLGVPVYGLGLRGGADLVPALWRLRATLRKLQPGLLQGWMYHGNLASSLGAGLLGGDLPVLWNIRQTLYSLANEKKATRAVICFGARWSSRPRRILYNSQVSAGQHEALGYRRERSVVIPNGFDTGRFAPSPDARARIREELGIDSGTPLVGLINRYHPMKDHAGFFAAARRVREQRGDVHFVLAGRGVSQDHEAFATLLGGLAGDDRVHLLGEYADVQDLMAALDISVSASAWGEGFSNVIGESMACAVPCVVTDVGDAAYIVGEHGRVVPPGDAPMLAEAVLGLLAKPVQEREAMGAALRTRLVEHFTIDRVAALYRDLYASVLE